AALRRCDQGSPRTRQGTRDRASSLAEAPGIPAAGRAGIPADGTGDRAGSVRWFGLDARSRGGGRILVDRRRTRSRVHQHLSGGDPAAFRDDYPTRRGLTRDRCVVVSDRRLVNDACGDALRLEELREALDQCSALLNATEVVEGSAERLLLLREVPGDHPSTEVVTSEGDDVRLGKTVTAFLIDRVGDDDSGRVRRISKILEKVHEDVLDVLDRDAVVLYLDSQFHFAPTEARHVAWHVSTRGAGIDCVGLERQVW